MAALLNPDQQAKVMVWRQKAQDKTLTQEEMKEIVLVLREGRMNAAHASEASKAKRAKKEVRTADELLGLFGKK